MADKKSKLNGLLSKGPVKIALVIILLATPLVILMLVFRPMAGKKTKKEFVAKYTIPKDYKKVDLVNIVSKMRKDKEFEFYFFAMGNERIAAVTENAISVMLNNRTKESLLSFIKTKKQEVHYLSVFFLNMNFPNEFYTNPSSYPQLDDALWKFITREFEVTLLAACYKSLYDANFSLKWEEVNYVAAMKLKDVILNIKAPK
jgi:hypothetical protein